MRVVRSARGAARSLRRPDVIQCVTTNDKEGLVTVASRTITLYVDDLDGTEIKEGKGGPVSFGLDGQDYSIDLTEKNAAELRKALQPFIAVAGKVARKAGTRARKSDSGPTPAELRAWAAENGFDVPTRGRIPDSIRTAWLSK